uniref:Uncharacterized protein n=1 Tax=Tetranychus urticae TaxID=32264 RepID=T1JZB8_TETUR
MKVKVKLFLFTEQINCKQSVAQGYWKKVSGNLCLSWVKPLLTSKYHKINHLLAHQQKNEEIQRGIMITNQL